jgi:chromosomal replication initiator protein
MSVDNIAPILNPPVERMVASPEIIFQIVTEEFKISLEDIKGTSRRREISTARQIGMYLMRQHTELSLPRIGEEFGGKDHTTVMYSCDKIAKQAEKDRELNQIITKLSDRINYVSKQQE